MAVLKILYDYDVILVRDVAITRDIGIDPKHFDGFISACSYPENVILNSFMIHPYHNEKEIPLDLFSALTHLLRRFYINKLRLITVLISFLSYYSCTS